MLKQEKVKNCDFAWHSGRIPELFSEFTRFGITHVQVKIDAIFLQIVKAKSLKHHFLITVPMGQKLVTIQLMTRSQ